jgi:hypothetical protein
MFRRLGGDQAAAVAERDFAELTEESAAEFDRVCLPLFSSKPGFAEELRQRLARSIQTIDVNLHFFRHEAPRFDPWSVLAGTSRTVDHPRDRQGDRINIVTLAEAPVASRPARTGDRCHAEHGYDNR